MGPVGNVVKAVALNPFVGQTLKSFSARVTTQGLEEVGELIESGRITPVIDRAFSLADAAAAVQLVEEGSPGGKVIVTVEPPRRRGHPDNPRSPIREYPTAVPNSRRLG